MFLFHFGENSQVQLLILSMGPLMGLIRAVCSPPAGLRASAQWRRHKLEGQRGSIPIALRVILGFLRWFSP